MSNPPDMVGEHMMCSTCVQRGHVSADTIIFKKGEPIPSDLLLAGKKLRYENLMKMKAARGGKHEPL